jgi:hypothetical protein
MSSLPALYRIRAALLVGYSVGDGLRYDAPSDIAALIKPFGDMGGPRALIEACRPDARRSDDALPIIIPCASLRTVSSAAGAVSVT